MAPSTKKVYARHSKRLERFCQGLDIPQSKYFDDKTIEIWIADLKAKGLAHGTILSHLSAVRHHCLRHDIPAKLDSPRIRLALRGIRRSSMDCQITKTAASTSHLKRLIAASTEIMSEKDHCRFAAMITIAFFGFLRPSEFCITSANHELKRSAVKFGKKGRSVKLTLPTFKHSRNSASIRVDAASSKYCPVSCLATYLDSCGRHEEGAPLFEVTAREFQSTLETVRSAARIKSRITPHCFRHGGATWASNRRWTDARIKVHGRWKSDAYKRYIRDH